MKSSLILLSIVFSLACYGTQKSAGKGVASTETSPATTPTTMSIGAGFATYGSGALGVAATPALSMWLDFTQVHSLQVVAGIAGTGPFQFGLGPVYRATIMGNPTGGFHVGGGFNLGTALKTATSTDFFLNIFPVVGFHFGLGGVLNHIRLSFDAGPLFAVVPTFGFSLLPTSALAGAAIHYFF